MKSTTYPVAMPDDLLGEIRRAAEQTKLSMADVIRQSTKLMKQFCGRAEAGTGAGDKLSDRELQVFQLVGSGLATRRIAEQLHLSARTVETHRENIKHKLGLPDAASLVHAAEDWLRASGE
jgi:DNA-binding NarL/FixJ family response regulator